jgi:hypothetical protein
MGAHTSGALGEGHAAAKETADQLATLAEPGELLVSDQVRDVLTDGLDAFIEDVSDRKAHAPSPLRAYRASAPARQLSDLQGSNIHPVLAIVPFELESKQPKHLLIGEVLAEEMIASFCGAKELAVISRCRRARSGDAIPASKSCESVCRPTTCSPGHIVSAAIVSSFR